MYMFKYVLKRLGLMLMTFCIIMLICFVLIKLLPITVSYEQGMDPNLLFFRLEARGYITNFVYNDNGLIVGYDRVPIMTQLWRYIKNIFHGDFGMGFTMAEYKMQPVWDVFIEKLPPTILINVYSTLIGVPIGLGLGILAALKKNKWQDQIINIVIILLISLPSIVLGLVIQYVFCSKLGWFPLTMLSGTNYFTWAMFRSMLPAVFALCLGSIAGYARYTRAELAEVLTGDYMLLARTKGLRPAGDVPSRAAQFHGRYFPVHTVGVRCGAFGLARHREHVLYPRRRTAVPRFDYLSRLRFLYDAVRVLYLGRAVGGNNSRYKLWVY